jgi:glycosyltransferase involved in cell wall biosynthesis
VKAEFLIDISRLLRRALRGRLPTGVDRVCLGYVDRWGERAQAVLMMGNWRRVLAYGDSQALFELLLAPPPDLALRMGQVIARACLPPWPSQQAAGKLGFYLGHSGIEESGFAEWLERTGQKPVYFVHDLIPITHPEYCRAGEQAVHVRRMKAMLQTGAGLIGNSQFTLDVLADFARGQGLPMPPAVVALLAPAQLPASEQTAPPLSQPYFVMLGTIEPRKNHLLVLNVWRELVQRLGASCPHLVVIGQRGWECENVLDMLERCEAIRPFVHEIAACPDADLARYLTHARALLFPSFIEGYGLPLVEAAQHNLPIIARDIPVFREVAGEYAYYFSGLTPDALAEVVREWLLLYKAGQAPQSDTMPRLTWQQSTQSLLDVIIGGNWYKHWYSRGIPDDVRRFWGSDICLSTQVGQRTWRDILTTGQAGFLIYGPYIPLAAGQYRVVIRGAVGEKGVAGAYLDVAADKGNLILGQSALDASDEDRCLVSLQISLDAPCTDLEVRVWVSGESNLQVSMIEISPWQGDMKEGETKKEKLEGQSHDGVPTEQAALQEIAQATTHDSTVTEPIQGAMLVEKEVIADHDQASNVKSASRSEPVRAVVNNNPPSSNKVNKLAKASRKKKLAEASRKKNR